jgi:seryl-tRNA(Sec) selenium transferase
VNTATPADLAYAPLGVVPVINACGIYTDLGGSRLAPPVWRAVEAANRAWAPIPELLDASGRRIAELTGAPAARVVPGASAAIALGVGACIAGHNGELNEQLPAIPASTPREVLMQRGHRYKYARCGLLSGATITEAGLATETSREAFRARLDGPVAAVLHPAHLDARDGMLRLPEVVELAHAANVPVMVDAAYLSYPIELIGGFAQSGADLVCFSAKYFHGPNAGGFVMGRADLVEAIGALDFTRYESGPTLNFGRPFKLDRTTIVATVVAFEEWMVIDHNARWADYARRVAAMRDALADVGALQTAAMEFTLDERLIDGNVNALVVVPPDTPGAVALERELASGPPRIMCVREGTQLVFVVETVDEADDAVIVRRLRELAGGR